LPPLVPELLPGLEMYARRYFEELFGLYSEPFVIVIDNCHEVPREAPLATLLLSTLFDSLPSHCRLLCLSRGPLPPALVRWSADPSFRRIDFEDLSFTDAEAIALADMVAPRAKDVAARCNCTAHGWVMGLKLLLGAPANEPRPMSSLDNVVSPDIFDYYATEVLARAPLAVRQFLMRAAVLEDMDAESADALTESSGATQLLEQLFADRLFVERRMLPSGPSYRFHPLFRDFLRAQLARTLSPPELAAHKQRSATLLEERGQFEAATAIALECDNADLLARLILRQAPQLAEQGRLATLERWLQALPQQHRLTDGWLLYWFGISSMVRDPARGRESLEQSYHKFSQREDGTGAWLAASAVICSHFLGWGTVPEQAWRWVEMFEALRADNGGVIPEDIELRIIMTLNVMTSHCPEHTLSRYLAARARVLAPRLADPSQRAAIGAIALGFLAWRGDETAAWALIDELALGRVDGVPASLGTLAYFHWCGILLWTRSEHERCFSDLSLGREVGRRAGLGLTEPLFVYHLALCALSAGDAFKAGQFVREGFQCLQPFHVNFMQAFRALHAMQLALAGQAEAGAVMARSLRAADTIADSPCTAAMLRTLLGVALLEDGALEEAGHCALEALELAGRLPTERWLFEAHMLLAGIELERRAEGATLDRLRMALGLASQRNFRGGASLFQPTRTTQLLGLALRHNIEADYVKRLIRHRKLVAPPQSDIRALWPVRLRVHTFGRFAIALNDQPLRITQSAGRKPLEVLKALIGLGAGDLSLASLGATLWPELDGAAAHNACHVAIHRLRKLLGDEAAIRVDHGTVTLNRTDAWVDVDIFRDLASRVRASLSVSASSTKQMQDLAEQLLSAYPGHFLPGEELAWAVGVREQLRARFKHLAIELTTALERAGAWQEAISLNRRGIELDPLAEIFHRGLMRELIALGHKAEALEAFKYCRTALLTGLRVEPSLEAYALHERIRQM
jgi:DNA-binding SARP family transcriptional activator